MTEPTPALYVLDTHALYWYWTQPALLGPNSQAVFQALESGSAVGLVPMIVIAELHYLTSKLLRPVAVEELLRRVDRASSLRLEPFTRRHLLAFGQVADVPEMHDRIIAAVALMHDAPLLSRDSMLQGHSTLRVIW
jgi:PIN domain nuclease of toxin-antitoxin system